MINIVKKSGLSLFLVLSLVSAIANAEEVKVLIGDYKKASFSPSKKDVFSIPLTINNREEVKSLSVDIVTQEGDVIRSLPLSFKDKDKDKDKKQFTVQWDGKDAADDVVPNEAYFPVLNIEDKKGNKRTISFFDTSGGEEVYDFEKNIRAGAIEYTLPVTSRILVRSGIKNGPMLRTVIDWEPRTAGFHADRWNGRDADDVMDVEQHPQVGYLIVGYKLPDHAILTYGNSEENYRAYRERKQLPIRQANYKDRLLVRDKVLIKQEFYTPILQQKSPRITAKLLTSDTREKTKNVSGFDELLTQVSIHELDEIYLDQERYEITFFVDNQFIAEEEQGFVPFTWRWSPGRYGIELGDHMLTINISGYAGQVGVKHIPFTVKK
ncbi:MAG: hypothetical protein ACI8VC_002464 [Candidatus Endobugula sp.]